MVNFPTCFLSLSSWDNFTNWCIIYTQYLIKWSFLHGAIKKRRREYNLNLLFWELAITFSLLSIFLIYVKLQFSLSLPLYTCFISFLVRHKLFAPTLFDKHFSLNFFYKVWPRILLLFLSAFSLSLMTVPLGFRAT